MHVGDESRQQHHVVGVLAVAAPVHEPGDALVQQLVKARPRQGADVWVGEVRDAEHGWLTAHRGQEFAGRK
jgi:hypothetical protein